MRIKIWAELKQELSDQILRERLTVDLEPKISEALEKAYLCGWADRAQIDRERNGVSEP